MLIVQGLFRGFFGPVQLNLLARVRAEIGSFNGALLTILRRQRGPVPLPRSAQWLRC